MKANLKKMLGMAALGMSLLWGVGTAVAGPPEWPECGTTRLTLGVPGTRFIDGQTYYVRRMATVLDAALDDFGATANSDDLEVFCVSRTSTDRFGKIAMCLSGEPCPWR